MKKVRGAGPELEIRFNAIIITEPELREWIEAMFDEIYNQLASSSEVNKSDPEELRRQIEIEVDKRIGDFITSIAENGRSNAVVIVKSESPKGGYLCDILPTSQLYFRIITVISEALLEALIGKAAQEASYDA
jgi:hypothetical protein